MKEHAIPQDVTGYKFHIVGNMTLGQFAQLVAGAILGFVIYQTNLYPIIKWPIIGIIAMVSVVSAFIPIAERPLTHWIKTFFMVLYRPTKFAWRRVPKIPDCLLYTPATGTGPVLPELDLTPVRRKRIQEFIQTTHLAEGDDPEQLQISSYYEHVFSLFTTQHQPALTQAPVQVNKPSLKVRTRSMRANPSTPLSTETALSGADGGVAEPIVSSPATPTPLSPEPTEEQPAQKVTTSLAIPPTPTPAIKAQPAGAADQSTPAEHIDDTPVTTTPVAAPQPHHEQAGNVSKVTFNKKLPFPSTPTTPNKLVGMILTPASELVEGAIVEIQTPDGQVVRAVRSNALGQFYVTTPLANGDYVMAAEKAGLSFQPLSIKLTGKIVDPIEIRSEAQFA